MKEKNISLDQLYVASSCPANWNTMQGDDKVRYCNQCQLNVYNISAMTRSQAELLITKTEGQLCGRFYKRDDGTVLTTDCPVGLRAIKQRVSKFASAALTTILGFVTNQALVIADDNHSSGKSYTAGIWMQTQVYVRPKWYGAPGFTGKFTSALRNIKRNTKLPILLPESLPASINENHLRFVMSEADVDSYSLTLSYGPELSNAEYIGSFSAKRGAEPNPDVDKVVKLAKGIKGYYLGKSCGVSCAPYQIEFVKDGVLYGIQFNLGSSREKQAEIEMIKMANDAINTRPR